MIHRSKTPQGIGPVNHFQSVSPLDPGGNCPIIEANHHSQGDAMTASYWPDDYLAKRRTASEAIRMLRPGQRVFIGSSCGSPSI
jgi:hypothetical protein